MRWVRRLLIGLIPLAVLVIILLANRPDTGPESRDVDKSLSDVNGSSSANSFTSDRGPESASPSTDSATFGPGILMRTSGEYAVLSPDGSRVFVVQESTDPEAPPLERELCVYGVDEDISACATQVGGDYQASWSPDGTKIAFTHSANQDVWVMDAASGDLTPITDEGLWDEDHRGEVPSDSFPVFSPDGRLVVFLRDYADIGVAELHTGEVTVIPGPVGRIQGREGDRPLIYSGAAPLPIGDRRVLVSGRESIFEVDIATGMVTEFAEVARRYQGNFKGSSRSTALAPVGMIGDSVVLMDPSVVMAWGIMSTQGTSGAYLLTPGDDLVALFRDSTDSGDFLAPVSIGLDEDGAVLFWWLDGTRRDEAVGGIPKLFLSSVSDPMPEIDPSSGQEVWGDASFLATGGDLSFVVGGGRVAFVEEADDGTHEVLVVDLETATSGG